MTIRSKLILGYAILLAIVLAIAGASIWSIMGWSRAAEKLSAAYSKGLLAERLRANMTRQISYGRDFIYGEKNSKENFWQAQDVTTELLSELKADASGEDELDHISGLSETQYELVWVMTGLFEREAELGGPSERESARNRLREISDEVSDDIAALNQYYRARENRNIASANEAGTIAMIVIGSAAAIAVLQLLAIIFLLQRWLAYPITLLSRTTSEISKGNFESRLSISSADEWGDLAAAINQMSLALKVSQQRLLLQERLAALGEIGSYTAHNLRNPLAGIRAAAQVALSEQSGPGSETSEALSEIIDAVDRMDNWIKRFLSYAKPLNLEIDSHDINQIITQVGTMAHLPYTGKAEIRFHLSEDLPEARIDGILIEQAIHVVVTNAFEALGEGGTIEIETKMVDGLNNEKWVMINVKDNGKGIPPYLKQRLFKPFVSGKEGGTGLGLAQAKKIVDLHGGEIDIDSLASGTNVCLKIPLVNTESLQVNE